MIRNVVLHFPNEQPLLADLYDLPGPTDAGLLCTNVRGIDGHKPVFIDRTEATFFFPYRGIRFLEIPPGALAVHQSEGGASPVVARLDEMQARPEDRPRAYPATEPGPRDLLPVPLGAPDEEPLEPELDLEIDEDFLQRIRDI